MWKYIAGGVFIILMLVSGWYLLKDRVSVSDDAQPSAQVQTVATSTYATSTYSIVYPADFSLNDSYAYDTFGPKKLIHGIKFTIPETMATGTNLSSQDTGISVEQLPRAKNCTADIYITANIKAQKTSENGVEYSVASTSDAGAGNFYEEQVYALAGTHPCTAVRYFIHSTNVGNYSPDSIREYDRQALLQAFDAIRFSLTLQQ